MKTTSTHIAALWLGFLTLVIAGCDDTEGPDRRAEYPAIQANTMTVSTQLVPRYYSTSGTVTSDHRVSASSRLSGYITELPVREGQMVKLGDLLFRIDPVDARQTYEQAQADLKNIEIDLKRYEGLLKERAVSQQQLDRVRLNYTVARSRMLQAKNQLQYASVQSPVKGYVVEKLANVGDLASPGKPVLLVEDPSLLVIETHVSEKVITHLNEGATVVIYAPALDRNVEGTIRQTVSIADPLTHQFLVKIVLPKPGDVLPGMFVEARFNIGQRSSLRLPVAALVHRAGLDGVYIVDDQSVLHYRQIRLGERNDDMIEVLAGLNAGQIIAWRPDDGLASGQRLTSTRP